MEENRKNRVVRIAVAGVLFAAALILTFLISYFVVNKLYSNYLNKQDSKTQKEEEELAKQDAKENVENCGFTMMYLDNPETEKVEYCLLRVFNELSGKMSIFQIPADSQVTLSDTVYEALSEKADSTMPHTLMISDIGTYFYEKETKYEMINTVIQDYIGGVEVRSYEAMDYEDFIRIVDLAQPVTIELTQIVTYTDETGDTIQLSPNKKYLVDGRMAYGILTYTDGFGNGDGGRIDRTAAYLMKYVTSLSANLTEEQMASYLSSYYDIVLTTGSTDNKEEYVKKCMKLTEENLSFYTLKGTQTEEAYVLDREKIIEDMQIIMGKEAYQIAAGQQDIDNEDTDSQNGSAGEASTAKEAATTQDNTTAQDEGSAARESEISSKDLSISVYNGAYINGLAGKWRDRLSADGYQIEHVNNYTDEVLEHGRIIVRKEGMGKDLQNAYFPNAVIEIGAPEDDMDIQIILGRSEDF